MRQFTAFLLRIALMLLLLSGAPGLHAETPDGLVLGVFPRRNAETTRLMFSPLARHLESVLGIPVVLETTYDFKSFWEQVESRRFHLVHYNQYHYLKSHEAFGYRVILKNHEAGSSNLTPVFIVRRDSGIKNIQDLKGRKIIFGGGNDAMVSHIAPRYMLMRAGLRSDDYLAQFALNPIKACIAVYYRQGSAAAVGHVVPQLASTQYPIDPQELTTIAHGEPLTQLPWAVRGDLPAELVKRITDALLALNRSEYGAAVLHKAGLSGLRHATDAEYDPQRAIIRSVLGERY